LFNEPRNLLFYFYFIPLKDEDVPESVKSSEAFAELMWLKLLKRVKGKQNLLGPVVHYGYCCDRCGIEPISGTRWHCSQCPPTNSIGTYLFKLIVIIYIFTFLLGYELSNYFN
jgi:hypothetical protein